MSELHTYDAFLSYASADLAFAEQAHRRLRAAGFRVWFDKARLNPGCDWHKEIEAGCEASRVLLPVLTPRWKKSAWTRFETYGAEAVIPLLVEGSFDDVFTPPLTRFQGQSLELSGPDETAWQRLFDALRQLLEKAAPEKTERLADLRCAANPYFVGREKELNDIHEGLHQNPTTVLTQGRTRAVTALGGVGKTTLARQYVEKFWRCYPHIFWIDCRLGLETEFARLCDLLLPEQRTNTNVVEKAGLALRELHKRTERLLIVDNAEDETSVQAWLPRTGHCRTLITSRFAGWSAAVKAIRLDVLEPEPAGTLLVSRAGRDEFLRLSAREQTACAELARQLGYLPLALEQAAAYIEQQGPDFLFADYLRLYEAATRDLLAAGVLGSTEYPDSVLTTWTTTTAKLGPASRAILRLCSFLAPAPLPLSVLVGGMEALREEAAAIAGEPLPAPTNAEVWVRQQVQQLRNYSMVAGTGQAIALHPLVQTVERLNLDEASGERRKTLEQSLRWINDAFEGDPGDVRSWPTLDPLTPHAKAVAQHADKGGVSEPTARLMNQLGILLSTKAQHAEAEPPMRRALAIDELSFGTDHPKVAIRLNNLAALLQATNRLAEAEPLMCRALAIDELSFGVDHPNVARDLNNLAQLRQATNRLVEAEPLMRRALAIDERSFGVDHPNVAIRLSNLAGLLQRTNRLGEAEPLIRRALAIDEHSFGADHPKVARDLNNLAQLLQATNRLAEAEPLMRLALAIDERSFGADHPNVAIRLNNLAQLLQATNRLAEAEPLMARVVTILAKSLGENHPNVATALNNLAQLLQDTNRLAEAEPLMRRALAIDELSFGTDHPEVATDLNNLAGLLQATNRLAEAEPLMARVVTIFAKSLGENHPNVASALNNLAQLLQATNRLAEAEPLMRRALAIDERSFGAEHPKVAIRLNNLAQLLQATNRLAEAEPLMRRMVGIFLNFTRQTGHQHPHLQAALGNYARLLQVMGVNDAEVRQRLNDLRAEYGMALE